MSRTERVLLWIGAVTGWAKPLLRAVNTIIGFGGFPDDLATWGRLLNAVVGGYTVLDWLLLTIGSACLILALSPPLQRLILRRQPAPVKPPPTETPERATRDPLRVGLYCGSIFISDSELNQKHFFDMAVRAFNGTAHSFQSTSVSGKVCIDFSMKGTPAGSFDVPAPVLYLESEKPHRPNEELTLGMRVFLQPNQVAEFRKREKAGETPRLMFDELDVFLETRWGKRMRLPLWDGVDLNGGRVTSIIAQSAGQLRGGIS